MLAWHGTNFLRGKTEGALYERARAWSRRLWWAALLPSTIDPAYSLTIDNAASSPHAMVTSFIANIVGMIVVAGYSLHLHRLFHGKTRLGEHAY